MSWKNIVVPEGANARLSGVPPETWSVIDLQNKWKLNIESVLDDPKNLETQRLIAILKKEVEKVSKSLNYAYETHDYEKRLSISDEKFKEVLDKILWENSLLKEAFENLLSRYSWDKEIYKTLLVKEFLEDLVYESLDEKDLKKVGELNLSNWKLLERLKYDKEQLLEDLKSTKSVDLSENNLWDLWFDELQVILSNLKNAKSVNLEHNNLWNLRFHKLQAILSNLKNAKSVNL